jgi:predicted nucleotidyltransferase
MIEEILPGTETKLRILRTVYENPEINLTELIKKARTSPNTVLRYVNSLTKFGVLKEKRLGGEKKTHIRNLSADLSSSLSVLVISFVEIEKRLVFLRKYREMKPLADQLAELFNEGIDFCLIYGSFARLSADKDSDLDVWIVGKPDSEMRKRTSEIFSALEREYSIAIEAPHEFLKNINNPIHQNMLREHIIIYNEAGFLKTMSKAH